MDNVKLFSIPSQMSTYSEDDSNLLKVRIKFNKTGGNYNYTKFTKEALVDAEPTLKNIPILAYIKCTDEELDKYDFDGHNVMTKIVESPNGYKVEFKYLERPIGVIPESNNVTYEESEDGEEYCSCDGYIWKTYANEGYEIIKMAEQKSVSMEIREREGHYDDEDDLYEISKFKYLGITVLGDDVMPAIEGANLQKYSQSQSYKEEMKALYEAIYDYEKKGEDVEVDFSKFCTLLNVESIENEDALYSMIEEAMVKFSNEATELAGQITELNSTIETKDAELEAKDTEMTNLNTELEELREFKKDIERKEMEGKIAEITDKYSELLSTDFSELTNKVNEGEMELADYEKELALLFTREFMEDKSKFSRKDNNEDENEDDDVQNINNMNNNDNKISVYGDISKYLDK